MYECHPSWTGSPNGIMNIHWVIFCSVEALIPIFFLFATNVWIFQIIRAVFKRWHKQQQRFSNHVSSSDLVAQSEKQQQYQKKQRQLVKVFSALLVGHCFSWIPTLLVVVISQIVGPTNIPPGVFIFGWITFISNPVIHPIIETMFVKDLRQRVVRARRSVRVVVRRVTTKLQVLPVKSSTTEVECEKAAVSVDIVRENSSISKDYEKKTGLGSVVE